MTDMLHRGHGWSVPNAGHSKAALHRGPQWVRVSEMRRGDRFVEVFLGESQTFLALEDAQPWSSADQPPGHRFKALGDRGPQVFYCATGWESYGPQLYRLPSPETAGEAPGAGAGRDQGDRVAKVAVTMAVGSGTPEIVILAQNTLWVRGLQSALEGLGSVVGWTVREWREHASHCGLRTAPRLVVHHCAEAGGGAARADARLVRELRDRWPGATWLSITDVPSGPNNAADQRLPQATPVEALRAAVQTLLAGGQDVAGP